MKVPISILLTLMIGGIPDTRCDEVYNVQCVAKDLAFLTTDPTLFTVLLPPACLHNELEGNFTLNSTCINNKQPIVVVPKAVLVYHITGGRDTRIFTLDCLDTLDGNGTRMSLSTLTHVVSEPDSIKQHIPVPGVRMFFTDVDPSMTSTHPPVLATGDTVSLGQKLYLVIESDLAKGNSTLFFLPQACEAKSSPPLNLTMQVWNRTSTDKRCTLQPSLMDTFRVYENGHLYKKHVVDIVHDINTVEDMLYNLAYAPIFSFYFEQMYVHDNDITYTCTFVVCPQNSKPTDYCTVEADRLSRNQCINMTSSNYRRRRNAVTVTSLDHVTTLSATLHVRISSVGASQTGTTSGTIVTVTTGVLLPVGFAILLLLLLLLLFYRRTKNKQYSKLQMELDQNQFELTANGDEQCYRDH